MVPVLIVLLCVRLAVMAHVFNPPALRRQRQDFCEFEALVYVMCSKTARSLHGDAVGVCGEACLGDRHL